MSADGPALQITGVRKSYGGLRPLRIQSLAIAAGERVAMTGLDAAAAEMMVNLVTGASLPDEGEIRVRPQHRRRGDRRCNGWPRSTGSASSPIGR